MAIGEEETTVEQSAFLRHTEKVDQAFSYGEVTNALGKIVESLSTSSITTGQFSSLAASLSEKALLVADKSLTPGGEGGYPGNPEARPKAEGRAATMRGIAGELRGYVVQIALSEQATK